MDGSPPYPPFPPYPPYPPYPVTVVYPPNGCCCGHQHPHGNVPYQPVDPGRGNVGAGAGAPPPAGGAVPPPGVPAGNAQPGGGRGGGFELPFPFNILGAAAGGAVSGAAGEVAKTAGGIANTVDDVLDVLLGR